MRHLVLVGSVLVSACLGPRADPSAYYLLNATVPPQEDAALPVVLGVGPIALPGYLDRPQIVVRVSENEIALAEADRWAEPLAENLSRALREDLLALLPGTSYVEYPWFEADAPDYGIAVEVQRFEADAAGVVELAATWEIAAGTVVVERRSTRVQEAAGSAARSETVAAQSRALAELSREIAAGVRRAAAR